MNKEEMTGDSWNHQASNLMNIYPVMPMSVYVRCKV